MPGRYIRPEILYSARVDALSVLAELGYRRLMSGVDDWGRSEADPLYLRAICFPLRADRVSLEEMQEMLNEWTAIVPGFDEPLVTVYQIGGKKYLQINNFRQRLRGESKHPGPPERETSPTNVGGPPRSAASRAFSPSSSSSSSNSEEGGAGGNQTEPLAEADEPALVPPKRAQADFDRLAEKYPQSGRVRLQNAFRIFRQTILERCREKQLRPEDVLAEMDAGLNRWLASEIWQAGKVHSLGNWIAESLWLEYPQSAEEAERLKRSNRGSRASPTPKRDQGLADFDRRMAKRMEDQGHGKIHSAGSG